LLQHSIGVFRLKNRPIVVFGAAKVWMDALPAFQSRWRFPDFSAQALGPPK